VVRFFPFPAFLLEHDVTPQQFFIIFRFVRTRFFAAEGTMYKFKCTYEAYEIKKMNYYNLTASRLIFF